MPDFFSWSHILILLVVALVVVGPKDLPRLMHMVGQWAGKARNMANEFKKSFDDMARQEELDKLRVELEALRKNHLDHMTITDPVGDLTFPAEVASTGAAPEPRSGEFQINDAPATPPAAPAEPALAGGHEPQSP